MIKIACWGSFDYKIHIGHIAFLNFALSFGDHLCVFVVEDSIILTNKNRSPIYKQDKRCFNVESLPMVNKSIALRTPNLLANIEQIILYRPNIFVFGFDQLTLADVKIKNELLKNNIIIRRETGDKIISTTEILIREGFL